MRRIGGSGSCGGTQEIKETVRFEVRRQGTMRETAGRRQRHPGTQIT